MSCAGVSRTSQTLQQARTQDSINSASTTTAVHHQATELPQPFYLDSPVYLKIARRQPQQLSMIFNNEMCKRSGSILSSKGNIGKLYLILENTTKQAYDQNMLVLSNEMTSTHVPTPASNNQTQSLASPT